MWEYFKIEASLGAIQQSQGLDRGARSRRVVGRMPIANWSMTSSHDVDPIIGVGISDSRALGSDSLCLYVFNNWGKTDDSMM